MEKSNGVLPKSYKSHQYNRHTKESTIKSKGKFKSYERKRERIVFGIFVKGLFIFFIYYWKRNGSATRVMLPNGFGDLPTRLPLPFLGGNMEHIQRHG